jgi:hypothetical protein
MLQRLCDGGYPPSLRAGLLRPPSGKPPVPRQSCFSDSQVTVQERSVHHLAVRTLKMLMFWRGMGRYQIRVTDTTSAVF